MVMSLLTISPLRGSTLQGSSIGMCACLCGLHGVKNRYKQLDQEQLDRAPAFEIPMLTTSSDRQKGGRWSQATCCTLPAARDTGSFRAKSPDT